MNWVIKGVNNPSFAWDLDWVGYCVCARTVREIVVFTSKKVDLSLLSKLATRQSSWCGFVDWLEPRRLPRHATNVTKQPSGSVQPGRIESTVRHDGEIFFPRFVFEWKASRRPVSLFFPDGVLPLVPYVQYVIHILR